MDNAVKCTCIAANELLHKVEVLNGKLVSVVQELKVLLDDGLLDGARHPALLQAQLLQ
jgi:hypothetical protein